MYRSYKRLVGSKLKKTRILLRNRQIASYLPPTKRFNLKALHRMLNHYQMVYLKPVNGLKGRGVVRARKVGKKYELRGKQSMVIFTNFQDLYRFIHRNVGSKPYLIQKGIHMLQYHGRSFDLRIMVMKNRARRWEIAGIVGRVAPPRMIVTNRSQGGRIMSAKTLLRSHMNPSATRKYLRSLYRLGLNTGRQFSRAYPKVWQLGVDIAVSKNHKPWILEVNTDPAVTPFIQLGNKRMYSRIIQLKRLTGDRSYLQ